MESYGKYMSIKKWEIKYAVTIICDDFDMAVDLDDGKYHLGLESFDANFSAPENELHTTEMADHLPFKDDDGDPFYMVEVKDKKIVRNRRLYACMNLLLDSFNLYQDLEDTDLWVVVGFHYDKADKGEPLIIFQEDGNSIDMSDLK